MKLKYISIKTVCAAVLFVALYFAIWRPVRVFLIQKAVRPAVEVMISASSTSFFIFQTNELTFHLLDAQNMDEMDKLYLSNTASNTDRITNINAYTAYTFKGFGGRFFLLCGFVLLLFRHYKFFWWLFLFHQAATLLLFLITSAGLFIHSAFFYVFDLVNVYLIPSFSVIFVLLPIRMDDHLPLKS